MFVRLDARALVCLAATCRLLQYGQSSPQTPNPVEDVLRLRAELCGWSRTLPVDSRRAVEFLLRSAWRDDLEFLSVSASRFHPVSFFVDSGGSLFACGMELQGNEETDVVLDGEHAAIAGSLGFGHNWSSDSTSACLRREEPTLVPAVEGVRMRSVANGAAQSLALTDEGQAYTWGSVAQNCRASQTPTLFKEVSSLKVRRVAAGAYHGAALTDAGKLYTWWVDEAALEDEAGGAAGAGYPLPDLGDCRGAFCRPRCVGGDLAGMRVASVAADSSYDCGDGCRCGIEPFQNLLAPALFDLFA
jgi:alpha-tubulin suppressor-like RCC1 family protein